MIVGGLVGYRSGTDLYVEGDTYVSWAITNRGRAPAAGVFFVDLLFDGIVVERWTSQSLPVDSFQFVEDWGELLQRVRLQPGRHTLMLRVDSTNLIAESDESDNVFEWTARWESSGLEVAQPAGTRLQDVAPFTPAGWDAPLIATSYSGDDTYGPLSVDVITYIRYGVANQGLASIPDSVRVHVYLDDILVMEDSWRGLMAGQTSKRSEWDGLLEATHVSPGDHSLRLVVDATDLVIESDEENNVVELTFSWDTGEVPARPPPVALPEPTAPEPLTLPNLVPGWRYGWDGPIIVSNEEGTFQDSSLSVGDTPFIDVVVHNQSAVEVVEGFEVGLYLDGEAVHSFHFSGRTPPGSVGWFEDWGALGEVSRLTEGTHTLQMVIDPDNTVPEADESDNVFEKAFVWSGDDVAEAEPIAYSDAELRQMLVDLQALLDARRPALSPDGRDYTEDIRGIAEAGYYLLTGRGLGDERVEILLLSHDDYLAWIDDDFADEFAKREESEYPGLLAARERFKKQAFGFKTRRFGKVFIVVDAEQDTARVTNSLAHELGHMRQDFVNPAQNEAADFHFLRGLREAEAQQFERAFWLKLEEFTGLKLLEYPDHDGFRTIIDLEFRGWTGGVSGDEHSLGHLLQYLAVLDDPELVDLRAELIGTGRLSASSSLRLYDYLVGLSPETVQANVSERLSSLTTHFDTMVQLSKDRLISNPVVEGSPELRVPGLMAP